MAHSPQCALSEAGSMQFPSQDNKPLAQARTHWPPAQTAPPMQGLLQRPQCALSFWVLTQSSPQLRIGASQLPIGSPPSSSAVG
jgi:hypothetical protein